MSGYSGKCDVYDSLVMIREVKDFSNVKIYAADNEVIPLKINSKKDLIPYYPYLTSIMCGDSEGNTIIHLSKKSFVDAEEEEILGWRLDELKKYYRRCKRNKTAYDKSEALKLITYFVDNPSSYSEELVNRVAELGEKATIEGVHLPSHDHMRKKLYEEMIAAGYPDDVSYRWCFGWNRWLNKESMEDIGDGYAQGVIKNEYGK